MKVIVRGVEKILVANISIDNAQAVCYIERVVERTKS